MENKDQKIDELIKIGKSKGYLSYSTISTAVGKDEQVDAEELDDIIIILEGFNIKIINDESMSSGEKSGLLAWISQSVIPISSMMILSGCISRRWARYHCFPEMVR